MQQLCLDRVIDYAHPLLRAGLLVILERPFKLALVLVGLAEREQEVCPRVIVQLVSRDIRFHHADFLGGETKRLQVGEAPVDFSKIRLLLDGAAIGRDAIRLNYVEALIAAWKECSCAWRPFANMPAANCPKPRPPVSRAQASDQPEGALSAPANTAPSRLQKVSVDSSPLLNSAAIPPAPPAPAPGS